MATVKALDHDADERGHVPIAAGRWGADEELVKESESAVRLEISSTLRQSRIETSAVPGPLRPSDVPRHLTAPLRARQDV